MVNEDMSYKLNLTAPNGSAINWSISSIKAHKIIQEIMDDNLSKVSCDANFQLQEIVVPENSNQISKASKEIPSKQFMAMKKPQSGIERIVCLAYYLTHIRGVQAFKSHDITKLNTDAAGKDFKNISVYMNEALKAQYFAKAGKGQKQIADLGEQLVTALPNREQVKKVLEENRPARKSINKKKNNKKSISKSKQVNGTKS